MPEEPTIEETGRSGGISRRTLIKGGAIVGGAVWVAPVIDSFTSPAAAVSAPPGADLVFSIVESAPPTFSGGLWVYAYNFSVTNIGPLTATNVSWLLTSTYTFNGGTSENYYNSFNMPTTFDDDGGSPNHTTNYLTPPLPAGSTWTINVGAKLSPGASIDMEASTLKEDQTDPPLGPKGGNLTLTGP